MKRVVSVLLFVAILSIGICAHCEQYSSMSAEELQRELDIIRNELLVKSLVAEKNAVVLDKNNVYIYISGDPVVEQEYSWSSGLVLRIPVVVINNTTMEICPVTSEASVNGWATDASLYGEIPAGKKLKTEIEFDLEETDLERTGDFTDAEFKIVVYNNDDWFGDKVVPETKSITIYGKSNAE